MEAKTDVRNNIINDLVEELEGRLIDWEIPDDLVEKARENNMVIVYPKNSYSVCVLGAGDYMTRYQNAGCLYISEDEAFTEPLCHEYGECKYHKIRAVKTGRIFFKEKAEANIYFCETDIPGESFNLFDNDRVQATGIVFYRDDLRYPYSDTDLINFLELLDDNKLNSNNVTIKRYNTGWAMYKNRKKKDIPIFSSVRAAVINFMRQDNVG
jgi:hypothetical protein